MQGASLEECEAILAGRSPSALSPLLREALLLRLSELDPERLATLLFEEGSVNSGLRWWMTWMTWLAKEHPDLLRAKASDPSLTVSFRQMIESYLRTAEFSRQQSPSDILEDAIKTGNTQIAYGALLQLADEDPDLAISYLAKLLQSGAPYQAVDSALFAKLAEANVAGMQAVFAITKNPELQVQMASAIARVLTRDDPALGVAFFESLPPSRVRALMGLEIAATWTKKDPEAALAWVQAAFPEGSIRQAALAIALAPLAESDPQRVLSLLEMSAEFNDRLFSVVSGNSSTSLNGIRNFNSASQIRERAALAYAAQDPAGAAMLLLEQQKAIEGNKGILRHVPYSALPKVVGMWFEKDTPGAVDWLSGLNNNERQNILGQSSFYDVLQGLSAPVSAAGMEAIARMEDKDSARSLLFAFAPAMIQQDPAAAFTFANDLPDGLREEWLGKAIGEYAKTDASAAALEIPKLPAKLRPDAHTAVATAISESAPDQAVAYLDSLPAEEKKATSYSGPVSAWAEGHWVEAEAWWKGLPADDNVARPGALAVIAGRLYESDPSAGNQIVGLIGEIQDLGTRSRALQSLVMSMAKDNPEAARALAEQPGMTLPGGSKEGLKMILRSILEN